MKTLRACVVILARFSLSSIFLASATSKILRWQEEEARLLNSLSEWHSYARFSEELQNVLAALIPWASVLLLAAVLFELIGGLSVLLGVWERLGAWLLILFLIPTTLFAYPFWVFEGAEREMQTAFFLKNLAIFGGLILLALHGAKTDFGKEKSLPPLKFG